jgi:hypothetical protein
MKYTENLTADRLLIGTPIGRPFLFLLEQKRYLLRADLGSDEPIVSTCRMAMPVRGQQLDFEPVRKHKPPHGGTNRSDNRKEGKRAFSLYSQRFASHTSYAMVAIYIYIYGLILFHSSFLISASYIETV